MDPKDRRCELLRIENRSLKSVAAGTGELSQVLTDLCRATRELFGAVGAGIFSVDAQGRHLSFTAAFGLPPELTEPREVGGILGMVTARALAALPGQPLVTDHIPTDPHWQGVSELACRHRLLASWAIPINHFDGSLAAMFGLYFSEKAAIRLRDVVTLERIGRLIHLIMERNRRDRELEYRVHHDRLTGLPNRWMLMDRLKQGIAHTFHHGGGMAVLLLDLDGFKPVNDRLGHGKGDTALVQIAARIRRQVRECDVVARLGGDEFVVVMDTLGGSAYTVEVAHRLIAELRKPLRVGEDEFRIGASVGISLFPEHGRDGQSLIDAADQAMYQAKRAGGGTFRLATQDAVSAQPC